MESQMRSLTTPAVVLRRTDYGESHRMVLLATREAGTLSVMARHARRSTKRFGGALELFTVFKAVIERKKEDGPWSLSSARVVRYHEGFASDVGRFAAGSYAVELYRMLVPQEVIEEETFSWLIGFFEKYESRLPDPARMAMEELTLLAILGHGPRFDRCVTCGREAPPRSWSSFDHAAGGIVCRQCGGTGLRLGSRLRTFLISASEGGAGERFTEELLEGALAEAGTLRRCIDLYVRAVADREPRSMPALRNAWGLD
jgi:DNA repair protein RecO (recombination protein O)